MSSTTGPGPPGCATASTRARSTSRRSPTAVTELPAGTRLGAIRLRAGDVGLMRDFYERAIGLRALPSGDGVTALGAGDGPLVELVSAPDAPARPRGTTGLFHLALLVPNRVNLAHA